MARETHAFGLPRLNENPFSVRPLEAGESGKLVGREDVFLRLQSYLKLGSARRSCCWARWAPEGHRLSVA